MEAMRQLDIKILTFLALLLTPFQARSSSLPGSERSEQAQSGSAGQSLSRNERLFGYLDSCIGAELRGIYVLQSQCVDTCRKLASARRRHDESVTSPFHGFHTIGGSFHVHARRIRVWRMRYWE